MSSVGELKLDQSVILPRPTLRWLNLAFVLIPFVILVDAALILGCGLGSTWLYHQAAFGSVADMATQLTLSLSVSFYFVLINAYRHSYSPRHLAERTRQIYETATAWTLVFVLLAVAAFLLKFGGDISRGATILFFLTGGGSLLLWRGLLAGFVARARAAEALAASVVVLITDRPSEDALYAQLRRSGLQIAKSFVFEAGADASSIARQALAVTSANCAVESIFLALPWRDHHRIEALLSELAMIPLPVRLLPDTEVAAFIDKPIVGIGALRAAEIQRMPLTLPEQAAKRAFDLIVASCLGLLILPVLIFAAVLIKLDSKGPAIFRQTRNGFNNRAFRIYKFRTLRTMEDGAVIKQVTAGDPRLTRVGRILRRFSIDELPQLLNVLRGDMSLVGPRPHATAHNMEYGASIVNYAFRHHVKPGLTGWAQIHGLRGETRTLGAMQRRIDFDMWYINNWSLWLDVKIVLKTIPEVLN